MTFGASSAMFREWPKSVMGHGQTSAVLPAAYGGLGQGSDVVKAALYNDTPTPDKDAALTSTGYNTGQWAIASREVSDGTNWDAGGEPLTSKTLTVPATGVFQFDAADTPQSGASCTLASVFGCLVYDETITAGTGGIAKQGITYHSFGGSQSVTAGTFTIVWHANGLFRITVA